VTEAGATKVFQAVAAVLTALAGFGVYVYLAGGAVLWVRLWKADIPAVPLISELPREFLITVGLTEVVVPVLVLAITAGCAIAVSLLDHLDQRRGWHALVAATTAAIWGALGFFLVRLPAEWSFAVVVSVLITYAVVAVLHEKSNRSAWLLYPMTAIAVGVLGAAIRIGFEAANTKLPRVVVCLTSGDHRLKGRLIAETSTSVYVAQQKEKQAFVMPTSRVAEVILTMEDPRCPPTKT
jgi:hypothetical protein